MARKTRGQNSNKGAKPPTLSVPHGSSSTPNAETPTQDGQRAQDSQFPLSPSTTQPASPASDITATGPPITVDQALSLDQTDAIFNPAISAEDIVSKDIVAIADIFATMKKTMLFMTNTFDRFEVQTEKFTSLSLDIKATEQVCPHLIVIMLLSQLNFHIAESSTQSVG